MSKEDDFIAGQIADLNAEKLDFAKDAETYQRIVGIDRIVTKILTVYAERDPTGQQSELGGGLCIVVNIINRRAAIAVGAKYKINVISNPHFPENEVVVTTMDSVETLIKSRKQGRENAPIIESR